MRVTTLPEWLTLAKFLGEHVAGLRDSKLVPQAREEMTAGERFAVKFGGRVVAWVSMPNAATRATVKDKARFTAWVKANLPGEIETVEQVRPGTQRQLLDAAKAGGWVNPDGGERVPIPGVEVSTGDLVPAVHLEDCAGEAIGEAWRAGEVDLGGLLALTAAPEAAPGVPGE
jgi:hypothetical protein